MQPAALVIVGSKPPFAATCLKVGSGPEADLPTVLHWVQATNRHSDLM